MEKQATNPPQPVFYKLEGEENVDWRAHLPSSNIVEKMFSALISNFGFRQFMLSDKTAVSLSDYLDAHAGSPEAVLLTLLNNYIYNLILGEVESADFDEIKTHLGSIFGILNLNKLSHAIIIMTFFCDSLALLNEEQMEKMRERNSDRFRNTLYDIEASLTSIKDTFFVEEIQRVFNCAKPPRQMLTVIEALGFLLKNEEIDYFRKPFTDKEICDLFTKTKPWHVDKFKRKRIRELFIWTEDWDHKWITKQSQEAHHMALWLEELLNAGDIIENIKSPSKVFYHRDFFEYNYLQFPGGVDLGFIQVDRSRYVTDQMHADYVIDRMKGKFQRLKKQGFRKTYLKPEYLLVFDGNPRPKNRKGRPHSDP